DGVPRACANRLPRAARSPARQARCVAFAVVGAIALGGCATLSPDGGFRTVQDLVKEHGGVDARWARTEDDNKAIEVAVRESLSRPLSMDDAMRIAILNNRGLQATYAELGIAETELVEANWPRNPSFTFTHLQGGGDKEIER